MIKLVLSKAALFMCLLIATSNSYAANNTTYIAHAGSILIPVPLPVVEPEVSTHFILYDGYLVPISLGSSQGNGNQGGGSQGSSEVTLPSVPSGLAVALDNGNSTISWNQSNNNSPGSYQLQQASIVSGVTGSFGNIFQGAALSFNQSATSAGLFAYRVRACRSGNCSDWSPVVEISIVSTGVGGVDLDSDFDGIPNSEDSYPLQNNTQCVP